MLNIEQAIEAWKQFEARANTKRTTQVDRIKEDRVFLSGKQWNSDDLKLYPGRLTQTVNIVGNSVNATANVYASYPYKFWDRDRTADAACEAFLKFGSNSRAPQDALYNTVAFGLAYMAFGSESVMDPETGEHVDVPALYNIENVENVYFDPDSVEMDGNDAVEAAIVEHRSKAWIRAKYGEEWVTGKDERAAVNTAENKSDSIMDIVTYFRVNNGQCEVYRMLNQDFIDQPTTLPIDRLPVFPVYGERTWDVADGDGDTAVWQGIVRKAAPIQKMINAAFTQLAERMAKVPKNVFVSDPKAVEGYNEGYRNFEYNRNPLLLFNATSPDGKKEYKPPVLGHFTVDFADITGIISSQLDLLSAITGVDAKGVMLGETPQKTATEVLSSERQTQCTVRHFYSNLKCTMKACGDVLLKLLNIPSGGLEVIQGPADGMQLQTARAELMQLMGVVPEDKRMQLVNGIFLTHPDNAVLANVFASINTKPGPTQIEIQQQDVIEQMKQAIGSKDQQIQELTEQVKRYEFNERQDDKSLRAEFVKMDVQHQNHMEEMALQAELNQGGDAIKAQTEAQKAQMDLEKTAIQLDTTKVKSAAEITKAVTGIANGGMNNAD